MSSGFLSSGFLSSDFLLLTIGLSSFIGSTILFLRLSDFKGWVSLLSLYIISSKINFSFWFGLLILLIETISTGFSINFGFSFWGSLSILISLGFSSLLSLLITDGLITAGFLITGLGSFGGSIILSLILSSGIKVKLDFPFLESSLTFGFSFSLGLFISLDIFISLGFSFIVGASLNITLSKTSAFSSSFSLSNSKIGFPSINFGSSISISSK